MAALARPDVREDNSALIATLLRLAPEERLALINGLEPHVALAILADWRTWARAKQVAPPGLWQVWIVLAGRGFGKTRVGAEWIHEKAKTCKRMFLLGATGSDIRDTMIEGESGLIATMKPDNPCVYQPGRHRVLWANGAVAREFSAERPQRLRGPQHEAGWIDELCAFQYPRESWDQMMFGLRVGRLPQVVVTTTPKPIDLIIKLAREAISDDDLRNAYDEDPILQQAIRTVITTGSSYENMANLSTNWFDRTIAPYEGTQLGAQEIHAQILTNIEGALWTMAIIEAARIGLDPLTLEVPKLPDFDRLVIAVDPAITMAKGSNETGIMACARASSGGTPHGYLLEDASGRYSPDGWARRVCEMYHKHKANRVVAEANQGGDLVKANIHTVDPNIPVKLVHATRGKTVRAEPIAAKYEQGKIHHVGTFGALESQLTTWTPDGGMESPDRMDALVWGFTDLLLSKQGVFIA